MQSTPSECKKGKAMYEAKIKKEKQTCKAKNNLKRKLKNDEEEFNIDGDMTKFLEHLDHHTVWPENQGILFFIIFLKQWK